MSTAQADDVQDGQTALRSLAQSCERLQSQLLLLSSASRSRTADSSQSDSHVISTHIANEIDSFDDFVTGKARPKSNRSEVADLPAQLYRLHAQVLSQSCLTHRTGSCQSSFIHMKRELLLLQSSLGLGDESTAESDAQQQTYTITFASQGLTACFVVEIVLNATNPIDSLSADALLQSVHADFAFGETEFDSPSIDAHLRHLIAHLQWNELHHCLSLLLRHERICDSDSEFDFRSVNVGLHFKKFAEQFNQSSKQLMPFASVQQSLAGLQLNIAPLASNQIDCDSLPLFQAAVDSLHSKDESIDVERLYALQLLHVGVHTLSRQATTDAPKDYAALFQIRPMIILPRSNAKLLHSLTHSESKHANVNDVDMVVTADATHTAEARDAQSDLSFHHMLCRQAVRSQSTAMRESHFDTDLDRPSLRCFNDSIDVISSPDLQSQQVVQTSTLIDHLTVSTQSLSNLAAIASLLLRQRIFNQLYASCFVQHDLLAVRQSSDHHDCHDEADEEPLDHDENEVHQTQAPASIKVTVRQCSFEDFSLSITADLNSQCVVALQWQVLPVDNTSRLTVQVKLSQTQASLKLPSADWCSRLLSSTFSVPVLLDTIKHKLS